ncbi:cephalosporin-C deacetylase [Streptomyces sp. Ag82_O1-12]|uniref:acetylxylan esterase n=1 Tax=unclassified Streptomyces TaxID=2593676 RepID=UPI000BCB2864|nr:MULTISPECIES: acetylxylan esterase [unclassified Streptomyces]SMQ19597.1 cephalosporin-C deacetylase [Streptomyces sp. Ag82_O1-12]SOD48638.1 cephalosporin-C deacetylase [Streptomyces sp. Ag82_G6-1]
MPTFDLPLPELERHRPDIEEPSDFDTFWRDTLKAAGERDPLVSVRPVETGLRLTRTWDVTFRGFGGDPVRAWFSRPAGVGGGERVDGGGEALPAGVGGGGEALPTGVGGAGETLPAVVEFAGYGRGRGLPHERLTWVNAGYAHLLMDNRGQGDQYGCGGDTPDPHAAAPGGPGPAVRGLLAAEDYHYRRLITDAVRAVAAVRALPGVDPQRTVAVGNSQGGGLALAVAGLVPDLTAVLVTAPLLCGIRRALDLTDAGPYGEIAAYLAVRRGAEDAACRTLSYVEGVSFARRAQAPAHFGVGLRDTVCPPSGVYAAFNRYAELTGTDPRKEIHAYPFNGHEGGEAVQVRRQLDWLRTVLKEPGRHR